MPAIRVCGHTTFVRHCDACISAYAHGDPAGGRVNRIEQRWSIKRSGHRVARLEEQGLTLYVSNTRVQAEGAWEPDRWGPVRWLVADDRLGTVAKGACYQHGPEYASLQRQAMLEAERAAAHYVGREAARAFGSIGGVEPPPIDRAAELAAAKARDIATAHELRAQGASLYAIATATGRSKEWLREYAGLR